MTKHEQYKLDNQYWIDRSGKIHKYKNNDIKYVVSIHAEIAQSLYPNIKHAKDFLLKTGWVMVGSSSYGCNIIHKNPSQSQINKLFDMGLFDELHIQNENCIVNYKKYCNEELKYEM